MKKSFKVMSLLLIAVMMIFVLASCDDNGKPFLKKADGGDSEKGTVIIVLTNDEKTKCSTAGKVIFNWATAEVSKSPLPSDGVIDVTDQKGNDRITVKLEPGDYSEAHCRLYYYTNASDSMPADLSQDLSSSIGVVEAGNTVEVYMVN